MNPKILISIAFLLMPSLCLNCLFILKSSIDLLLNDWDVKEQETLMEVERILDRTDKILEVMHFLPAL